jgi:ubiquitin carboxyl-terminal hydrolase 1
MSYVRHPWRARDSHVAEHTSPDIKPLSFAYDFVDVAISRCFAALNEPQPYPRALRPHAIIDALSHLEPGKRSPLFSSREHQDAQELFQLVSELVKKEATAVDSEVALERGFGAALDLSDDDADAPDMRKLSQKAVFDGLTANRRSCVECGYTEAVMHFSFDSWQLPLPRTVRSRVLYQLLTCFAHVTAVDMSTRGVS